MRTAGTILAVFAIALITSAAHGREQSVSQRLLTQMGRDYPKLYAQLEVQREVSVMEHLVNVIGIISNTTRTIYGATRMRRRDFPEFDLQHAKLYAHGSVAGMWLRKS